MCVLKIAGPALAALVLFCLPTSASPAGEGAALAAQKLVAAANLLPPGSKEEVRQKALAIVLLADYGRLLPPGLSPAQWEVLESVFLDGGYDEAVRRQQAAKLPPADTVSFDGSRLEGGGFARIDNMVGTNGRPVALDRRLPTRLVPLNPGEENRLHDAAAKFTSAPDAAPILKRTDNLYRARLDNHMVGDGIFYRPYAGRTDDLYYRLVQENPSTPSEMNFYATAESLPGRHYHPLTGIGAPSAVPPPWFSVNEILSGGGLLAVENYKNRNPKADVRNPFFGFAARVLPFMGPGLEGVRPGEELQVSREAVRNAIQNTRRFTPKPVEPIFSDPSHFFGCITQPFLRVSRKMTRAEMAEELRKIDFGTPLPDVPMEPVGNEVLVNPSQWTKAEFFQELPGLLGLDSSPQYNPDSDLIAGRRPTATPPSRGSQKPVVVVQTFPPKEAPRQPSVPPPPEMPLVVALPRVAPQPATEAQPPVSLAAQTPTPIPEVSLPPEPAPPGVAKVEQPPPFPAEIPAPELPSQPTLATATPSEAPAPALGPLLAENPSSPPKRFTLPASPKATPLPVPLSGDVEFPALASLDLPLPPDIAPGLPALPGQSSLPSPATSLPEPKPALGPLLAENPSSPPKRFTLPASPKATPLPVPLTGDVKFPALASLDLPLPPDIAPGLPALPTTGDLALFPPAGRDAAPQPLSGALLAENIQPPAPPPAEPRVEPATLAEATPASSPLPAQPGHYVAVLTPDISSSEKYLGDIADSDASLSKNAARLNRVNRYLKWLDAAAEPIETFLATAQDLTQAQKSELKAATESTENEMNVLLDERQALGRDREKLLAERGLLRNGIEGEPMRVSAAKLDKLLGRPVEVSQLFASSTPRAQPPRKPGA